MERRVPPEVSRGAGSPPGRPDRFVRLADAAALALGAALCIALAFLALSQPWVSDDFTNATFIRDNPGLAESVSFYYRTWTGRFSSSALTWFAAKIRPAYGALLWSAILGLVVMTFALARGRMPRIGRADLSTLALVLVAYWFGMPAIEETFFWATGSTVYLWPALLTLVFLYPYRRAVAEGFSAAEGRRSAVAPALAMFTLGVWVGASQEQVLAGCIAFLAIVGVRAARSKVVWRLPAHLYAGAIGLVAAGAVSLAAPGNGQRLTEVPSAGVLATAVASAKYLTHIAVDWLPPLVPWSLCLGLLTIPATAAIGHQRAAIGDGPARATGRRLPDAAVWLVTGIATIAPLMLQPYFGAQRTIMFLAVFLVVASMSFRASDDTARIINSLPRGIASAALSVVLLTALGSVALSGWQARGLKVAQERRAVLVRQQKLEGVTEVRVPRLTDETPRRGVIWGDGAPDPSYWVNGVMAGWYGVESLVVTDEVVQGGGVGP